MKKEVFTRVLPKERVIGYLSRLLLHNTDYVKYRKKTEMNKEGFTRALQKGRVIGHLSGL